MADLRAFVDMISLQQFGISLTQAHTEMICIKCHEPVSHLNIFTEADKKEYLLSGLCSKCYATIFEEKP